VSRWVFSGRGIVTRMIVAAGSGATKHFSSYHRVFSTAAWSLDPMGLAVFTMIKPFLGEVRTCFKVDVAAYRSPSTAHRTAVASPIRLIACSRCPIGPCESSPARPSTAAEGKKLSIQRATRLPPSRSFVGTPCDGASVLAATNSSLVPGEGRSVVRRHARHIAPGKRAAARFSDGAARPGFQKARPSPGKRSLNGSVNCKSRTSYPWKKSSMAFCRLADRHTSGRKRPTTS
jgi:hypothetical protein